MLVVSLYAAVWIAFYALPMIGSFLNWLRATLVDLPAFFNEVGNSVSYYLTQALIWIPMALFGLALFLYTSSLFILAPIAVPLLALRAWLHELSLEARRTGWAGTAALVVAGVLALVLLFTAGTRQPQNTAFALLDQPPATPEQARQLLAQQETIRTGLLNAYLAPFRYLSAQGEVWHVSEMYRSAFHMQPEQAFPVQRLYERVAAPLLYDPVEPVTYSRQPTNNAPSKEPEEAAQPVPAVLRRPRLMRRAPGRDGRGSLHLAGHQAEQALLAVDDREVHLDRQELTVQPARRLGRGRAVRSLLERDAASSQEVVYYFSLPEFGRADRLVAGQYPQQSG